jgi:hypothetical protein
MALLHMDGGSPHPSARTFEGGMWQGQGGD